MSSLWGWLKEVPPQSRRAAKNIAPFHPLHLFVESHSVAANKPTSAESRHLALVLIGLMVNSETASAIQCTNCGLRLNVCKCFFFFFFSFSSTDALLFIFRDFTHQTRYSLSDHYAVFFTTQDDANRYLRSSMNSSHLKPLTPVRVEPPAARFLSMLFVSP